MHIIRIIPKNYTIVQLLFSHKLAVVISLKIFVVFREISLANPFIIRYFSCPFSLQHKARYVLHGKKTASLTNTQKELFLPSFDVVSEVDMHELANALDQSRREISTRYDFRNSKALIESADDVITLIADNEFQIQQMLDIVYGKMAKRGVDIKSMETGDVERRGSESRQKITVRQGIDKDSARKIVKMIKASKLKVQPAIQDQQVRVTGKKRDELQNIMAMLREGKLDLALQFTNFRD